MTAERVRGPAAIHDSSADRLVQSWCSAITAAGVRADVLLTSCPRDIHVVLGAGLLSNFMLPGVAVRTAVLRTDGAHSGDGVGDRLMGLTGSLTGVDVAAGTFWDVTW